MSNQALKSQIDLAFAEAFDLHFDPEESEHTVVSAISKHLGGIVDGKRVRDEYRRRTLEYDSQFGTPFYVDDWGNDLRYSRD